MPATSYPTGIDKADEKAHFDVYARLRVITDWPGFAQQQRERRQWLRNWLEDNTDLSASQLDQAKPVNVCDLPSMETGEGKEGAQQETCFIAEREAWWNHDDLAGQWMKDAKKANRNWLEGRRKQVHGEHPDRWRYLSIATKHDPPWSDWKANHDTTTGEKLPAYESGDWRAQSRAWHDSHLGITEQPANSNTDNRTDGIRTSQVKCAGGGTWLIGQPWCGVWAFRGLLAADLVKADGSASWMASVASCEDYARQARGPFRGWTTDGSKAKCGDLVILFGRGQHIGTVQDISASYARTWEGNTSSSSSGSQSNGGGSYERDRSRSYDVYGYCLVG